MNGNARALSAIFFAAVALVAATATRGADAPPRRLAPITDAGRFWTVSETNKQLPHPLRFEFVVYYYDPHWKLLWVESRGAPSYVPVAGGDLRLKSGQRVLLEGTVVPGVGIEAEKVQVTVLEERVTLPAPPATAGAIEDASSWEGRRVSVEGYVCRQEEVDAHHVSLEMLVEGRLVVGRVLLGETEAVPQLLDAHVRVPGIYVSKRDPSGQVQQIELWVARRTDVIVTGSLARDARFRLPITAIDDLGASPIGEWVRIAGQVRAWEAGRALTVRDDTGQVTIATEQPGDFQTGERVEVVGRSSGQNLDLTLRDPIVRRAGAELMTAAADRPALKLRVVEQARELQVEEAERGYPVYLKGAVTWADPAAGIFFLQDATGGIRVRQRQPAAPIPEVGAMMAVTGRTRFGEFAPEIEADESSRFGSMILPAARVVTLEQALTGAEEGRRVEIRGYVRQVEPDGAWQRLDLATAAGEFSAYAARDLTLDVQRGALVRVTGVCVASANAQRQLTTVRLWLSGPDAVSVEEPAPEDPFTVPARTIASLRQFAAYNVIDRRVRVAGGVLHQELGRYLYLQDGDAPLVVLSRETSRLARGEWVEVAGFPGREGGRLVLREAVWRRRAAGPAPVPRVLEYADAFDPEIDARLVTIRARLQQVVPGRDRTRLIMSVAQGTFEAVLDGSANGLPREGGLLELTGVHIFEYDEYRRPRAFQLHLNSLQDVRVLQAASWWTAPRALAVAGGFGFCTLLGIVWVAVLRRRVNAQTRQIRAQMEKEAQLQAELERTRRLESLGVLAGGIAHDFNNLLTVVIANLSLALMDRRVVTAAGDILEDAERGARRAAELTQQLLTFARGGDPVRAAVSLPELVRESAAFALHGSSVRCEIDVAPGLPPANADRAQMGRVVHNLVLNAAQAMPNGGLIRIYLAEVNLAEGEVPTLAAGRYVKLSVADNGPGIAPQNVGKVFDPYFSTKVKNSGLGLATVHSIVKKHDGHVTMETEVGRGTVFRIWLPAVAEVTAPPLPLAPKRPARGQARVLFMDDEERIRQSAAGILGQLGHDYTLVADGAEAVQAYREARAAGLPFDVVILDLTVPGGMGGKAAMEELRAADPLARVIVSSGYSSDPIMAHCRAYGFLAALPKPYGVRELGEAIDAVLPTYRPGRTDPAVETAPSKR